MEISVIFGSRCNIINVSRRRKMFGGIRTRNSVSTTQPLFFWPAAIDNKWTLCSPSSSRDPVHLPAECPYSADFSEFSLDLLSCVRLQKCRICQRRGMCRHQCYAGTHCVFSPHAEFDAVQEVGTFILRTLPVWTWLTLYSNIILQKSWKSHQICSSLASCVPSK